MSSGLALVGVIFGVAELMSADETIASPPAKPNSSRFDSIDVVRGVALCAMAVFHTAWDLSFLGIVKIDVAGSFGWQVFARSIAGTFLFIAGASLVLAARNGFNRAAYVRRLAVIAAAAAAVSAGTYLVIGDEFVVFGILHHIALASIIGLAVLRLPAWVVAALVPLALTLPHLIASSDKGYGLAYFLGLAPHGPPSVDYVPLFPWLAAGFAGMTAARLALRFSPNGSWTRWRARIFPTRLLAFAGRWSLTVYLLHQPIILGVLYLLAATVLAPAPRVNDAAAIGFREDCQRSCVATGQSADHCRQACSCTEDGLKEAQLWRRALDNTLTSDENARVLDLARACARSSQ